MSFFGDIIGGIGDIIGGRSKRKAADRERDWNANQAQVARDWQAQMDNTAVQRRVADAKLAGISPLAALGYSANYSSPVAVSGQDPGEGALSSGLHAASRFLNSRSQQNDDRELSALNKEAIRSQIRATDAQTAATLAQATSRSVLSKNSERMRMLPLGINLDSDKKTTKYSDAADQYGMIIGEVQGISHFLRDLFDTRSSNMPKQSSSAWWNNYKR